jgi:hypothetical protein
MKTVAPTRFRPRLEALEERFLLAVGYYFDEFSTLHLRGNAGNELISITNNGVGHITVFATGAFSEVTHLQAPLLSLDGVREVDINLGDDGRVLYSQQGNQVWPWQLSAYLGRNNSLVADLQGHSVLGNALFQVQGGFGNDSVSFNAAGVNIAPSGTLRFLADGRFFDRAGPPIGLDTFSVNYSGLKQGKLLVNFFGGNGPDQFTLNASFLQGGRARRPAGVAPGDLFFDGGQGDGGFRMLLSGPDGLSLSGDVYGGSGFNSCFHSRNVRTHNIQHDITPAGKQTVTANGFPFPR